MDGALCRAHEARTHLDALGAERERRGQSAPVGYTAGCDDRDVNRIHELGNEHHGRELADVTAGLHAFADDRVRAD